MVSECKSGKSSLSLSSLPVLSGKVLHKVYKVSSQIYSICSAVWHQQFKKIVLMERVGIRDGKKKNNLLNFCIFTKFSQNFTLTLSETCWEKKLTLCENTKIYNTVLAAYKKSNVHSVKWIKSQLKDKVNYHFYQLIILQKNTYTVCLSKWF